MQPQYPVYIVSKGRWKHRKTSKVLEHIDVPYHIVIEPQEYKQYKKVINKKKILVLPFSNLGQGSIPARNWIWEHSISIGAKQHWIMDDNIFGFERVNRNRESRVESGTIFRAAEDFVNRYKNIGLSGFNYDYFVALSQKYPPFYLNTRVYSCILIKNKISFRWRGTYNEDTDLSLRVLKSGLCTILFNAFVVCKTATGADKGGNADELYKNNGRLRMAKSLVEQHPGIVTITRKYNRWQHQVYYRHFKKNRLIKKDKFKNIKGINNYGMKLIYIDKKGEIKNEN